MTPGGFVLNALPLALPRQTADPELLEKYQPGPIALLIVVLLGIAMVFLFRSMSKQMKRIDFDEDAKDDAGRARGRTPRGGPPADR